MIVIANNTEEKLLHELKSLRVKNSSQRCFYIALSKLSYPKRELYENFLTILHDLPNAYMAQVFLCNDKDVFILMTGFMQRHFEDFLRTFSQAYGNLEIERLGYVFEIGRHWPKLENLCKTKIALLEKKAAIVSPEEKKIHAAKITQTTLASIDVDLVSSIGARRANAESPRVLIVDDDQLSRTLAGNVLREDYAVYFAKNGAEALQQYIEQAPDIIFLDIGMPDISGHDVLETLFQMDTNAYVIMFSGRKDQKNIMRALEAGAQGFLGKPFTREELYRHVLNSSFVQQKDVRSQVRNSTDTSVDSTF